MRRRRKPAKGSAGFPDPARESLQLAGRPPYTPSELKRRLVIFADYQRMALHFARFAVTHQVTG